jgi:hypothetical protein
MNHQGTTTSSIALVVAACLGSVGAGAMLPTYAHASELDAPSLLWAARTCYLEASFNSSDCVALLWVARKKAERVQKPWVEVLRQYSSIRTKTPRAQEVSAFPWGDVPGKTESFNRRWQDLRDLVVQFTEGAHEDPCPNAEHWGGSMDHPQGRMIRARCAVTTANTFYAIGARSRWR